jgi:hypothetical protein
MGERKEKGVCLNCDNKCCKWYTCGENKLFYIDCEEEEYNIPQPTRLTCQQMDEHREKIICFNCDIKYIKEHK